MKTIQQEKPYRLSQDYNNLHAWLRRNYGDANYCSKDPTHLNRGYEWANVTGQYTRDVKNFRQLCRSCHRKMDVSEHQRESVRKRSLGNSYRSRTVFQFSKDGKLIKGYPSIARASDELNGCRTSIVNCLKGRTKTAAGFKWSYDRKVVCER